MSTGAELEESRHLSYDLESEASEDDCRVDAPNPSSSRPRTHTETQNVDDGADRNTAFTHIQLNESLTMQVPENNDDAEDLGEEESDKQLHSTLNRPSSLRSASIEIDVEQIDLHSNNGYRPSSRQTRSHTIEIRPDDQDHKKSVHDYAASTLSTDWKCCGRLYRVCCFSAFGLRATITLNLLMVVLNTGLIIYEIYLILRDKSLMHTQLPLWYMVCDLIVTLVLLLEIMFTVGAVHGCSMCTYFKSGWECWVDLSVLLLSIGCCAAYYLDFTAEDIDNLAMLLLRVVRDVIRILRCLWFFRMLYVNWIQLGIKTRTHSSFHGEPLLANKAWKSNYKLQINSSPRSTCSDQREYKGPKRVDVFDENDINEMMNKEAEKTKQRKMYSQTPSPPNSKKTTPRSTAPSNLIKRSSQSEKRSKNLSRIVLSSPSDTSHQRNLTRNCDEFTVDELNAMMNDEMEKQKQDAIRISDDRSDADVISINSGLVSGSNGSIHRLSHLHTASKSTNMSTEPVNSYDQLHENDSMLSHVTSGTNDNYYENLKLRHVKKKTVDKERLKELLRNLPSGSFDHRASFSDDDDSEYLISHQLHTDADEVTII